MRKLGTLLLMLFVVALATTSCRTQKQACAAYSSADQIVKDDSNS